MYFTRTHGRTSIIFWQIFMAATRKGIFKSGNGDNQTTERRVIEEDKKT